MKVTDKSIMFELWTECNNQCKFCYLGKRNLKTSNFRKLYNLTKVKRLINKKFKKIDEQYKAIGFIGGEFFQGQINTPKIKEKFIDLFSTVFQYVEENKIRDVWCYCTLTIGNQKDLYEIVELFNTMITDKTKHNFWILTSYDTWGRFHVPQMEENWNYHMLNLQKYPFIKFNITSVLSQDFCEKVISGKIDLNEFKKKYKCTYFFKQPVPPLSQKLKQEFNAAQPNWFIKRHTFLNFLYKIKSSNKDLFNNIMNIEKRSDDIVNSSPNFRMSHRNKETWEESYMKKIKKCGHVISYQCYADSDECCLCDFLKIRDNDDK